MSGEFLLLVAIGLLIGAIGTLIGAGGGFILMPVLLIMYPSVSPDVLTGISLAVVFSNAFSGSVAYGRMKRIDYKSGILFSLATIPGAILGAYTVTVINRFAFDIIFGSLMILVSIYLFLRPAVNTPFEISLSGNQTEREFADKEGNVYKYSFRMYHGIVLSLFVGYLSSMLGIGGGIIHVPAMVGFLNFPVHIATATSHFVLAIMALAGTLVHIFNGSFAEGFKITLPVAIGVIAGAQVGARFSNRVHGTWIVRSLAAALAIVGIRMLVTSL